MNDGVGGNVEILVGEFEPQVSQASITSFSPADTSKEYMFRVVATTSGGSVISGQAIYRLAAPPSNPNAPSNWVEITNEERIGVIFGENLPDNGGSQIFNIQLWMDDTKGNYFIAIGQEEIVSLTTKGIVTKEKFPIIQKGLSFGFKVRV